MRAYAFTYLVATVLVAVLCAHNAFAQEAPPAQPQPQVPVPEQAQVPAAATPAQPQPQVPEQVPVPVPAEAPAVVAPASATAAAAAGPQKTVGTLSAIELAEFRTELKAVFLSDNDGPGTSAGGACCSVITMSLKFFLSIPRYIDPTIQNFSNHKRHIGDHWCC